MSLRASMLCNTTIIRYLNKPTQSKTQLTQEVVNSFNTYYTQRTGEVKCSWFDDVQFFRLKGGAYKGLEIITRVHKWTLNKSSESFSPLLGVL
jgi:hypothetical protein